MSSIVGLALRVSAVRALQGAQTIAGLRWFDSILLPIDKIAGNDPLPFGTVSTEDENDKPAGRDLNSGSRTIDLLIEIGIAQAVALPAVDGGGDETVIQIVQSDAALELALAVLSREINACLWGRGGGLWGDAFRALAGTVASVGSRRGIPVRDGQRFAARQIGYTVQPIAEPPFGAPVLAGTPLAKFFEAATADPHPGFAQTVAIIRKAIEGRPVGWPELWTASALAGGYTEDEGEKIGIVPLGGPQSLPLSEVTLSPDGTVLDAAAIAASLPEAADE